jgi:EAL domain-containing protein (putative c-di-GMP-specific phosphodiesterase class I)/AmiR/NasT family two-component response regulator
MDQIEPVPAGVADLRFLVVEDHGFQRWALANVLTAMGARNVLSAEDGQSALDIIDNLGEPLDIIVTDLEMPGMDGMELIRHIGQRKIAVSLIVASGLDRSLVATIENMAREYGVELLGAVEKPTTAKKLGPVLARFRSRGPLEAAVRTTPSLCEEDIREGLKNDQFEPFFQAKMGMSQGTVVGAEALARWRHPRRGLLPPETFMEFVQGPELAEKLALVMARKGAQACQAWQAAKLPGTVSVNICPGALTNAAFADHLLGVVRAQALESSQMTLEVTESAASTPQALENLSRLRMHGFGLSIDDYGIGYSSMERLARIAFTELKIDRSFVRDALAQPASRAMLESSLEMAKKLGITAVAEGVETQLEWDLLKELGCDVAQGFLVAQPMDRQAHLDWLRRGQGGSIARPAGR